MKFNNKNIYLINLSSSNQGKINSNLKLNFQDSKIHIIQLNDLKNLSLDENSLVILPGVGSFESSSKLLKNNSEKLLSILNNKKIIKVCICLGFQILFDKSYEGGSMNKGLNFYKGEVISFEENKADFITNTGYSKIYMDNSQEFSEKYFFFNHRFYVDISSIEKINNIKYFYSFNGETKFLAMIFDSYNNILGLQFHPEMSGKKTLKDLMYNLKII